MIVRIRASSITVTAAASTNDPNGSPTRCATTSAWCTAANTPPMRNAASTTASTGPGVKPNVTSQRDKGQRRRQPVQDTRFSIEHHIVMEKIRERSEGPQL